MVTEYSSVLVLYSFRISPACTPLGKLIRNVGVASCVIRSPVLTEVLELEVAPKGVSLPATSSTTPGLGGTVLFTVMVKGSETFPIGVPVEALKA